MGVRENSRRRTGNPVDGVKGAAGEAVASQPVEWLLRLGYVARGLVYGMIGLLALKAATGGRGQFTDQQGAVAAIARTQWGDILLYIILAGLIGYGLLGLIRAFLDPLRKGNDAKGMAERLGYLVSGVSYLLLGYATYNLIRGAASAARNGAQGQQLRQTAGTILSKPWGVWVIALLGAIVIGIGVVQIVRAGSRDFNRQFRPFALSAEQRRLIDRMGRFGAASRGVVFALVGVFLFQAAYYHDPRRAQGIDGVLASLLHQPYGIWLLAIVAVGLIAFAIYSALSALWLRFPRPA
jgi:hypothetical protein